MSEELRQFHHVGIVIRDLNASIAWYEQHLGFRREREYGFPGAKVAHISLGNMRLEFLQVDGASPMAPEREDPMTYLRTGGVNHLAIAVDDIDGVVADLQAKGVDIAHPPKDGPPGSFVRFAFIRDNERMLIEICQKILPNGNDAPATSGDA